jgi:D-glycero-D-manno-heptose 1,7-bisphosphate phosphatase
MAEVEILPGVVETISAYLAERLPIDHFIMCYHDDGDNCDCRKPQSGLLLAGAREFDVDLVASYMGGRPLAGC